MWNQINSSRYWKTGGEGTLLFNVYVDDVICSSLLLTQEQNITKDNFDLISEDAKFLKLEEYKDINELSTYFREIGLPEITFPTSPVNEWWYGQTDSGRPMACKKTEVSGNVTYHSVFLVSWQDRGVWEYYIYHSEVGYFSDQETLDFIFRFEEKHGRFPEDDRQMVVDESTEHGSSGMDNTHGPFSTQLEALGLANKEYGTEFVDENK